MAQTAKPFSPITLANLAEAASYHATAAKLLLPFAEDAALSHLKNFRMVHRQIAELIGASTEAA